MKVLIAVADKGLRQWLARVAILAGHPVMPAADPIVASHLARMAGDEGVLFTDAGLAREVLGARGSNGVRLFTVFVGMPAGDDGLEADASLRAGCSRHEVEATLVDAAAVLRLRARLRAHVVALAGRNVARVVRSRDRHQQVLSMAC